MRTWQSAAWVLALTAFVWSLDLTQLNIAFVKKYADWRGRPPADLSLTYIVLDDEAASMLEVMRWVRAYEPASVEHFVQPNRPSDILFRWPLGQYSVITSTQLLHHEVDPELLRGKHVVLGDSGSDQLNKIDAIAIQRRLRELDANRNQHKMPVLAKSAQFASILLSTTVVSGAVISFGLVQSVIVSLGLAAAAMGISLILFGWIWIPVGTFLVAIALAFYVTMPIRALRENRKRWDLEKRETLHTKVEELKINFLSLVTHDLKTPVAKIQGLTEVLRAEASQRLTIRDNEHLDSIVASSEDLNQFINSLLELSRLESEHLLIQKESKDVNRLVEQVIREFSPMAKRRSIEFCLELEPLFPIEVDAKFFVKVIRNLVDNAIKYSPDGSMVTVRSSEKDGMVFVEVRDQGIGLASTEIESVFTKFYRANNTTTRSTSGSGLGLYLSRFFIQAMGGTISVQSELGRGSVFVIGLPQPVEIGLRKEADHVEHSRRRR